MNRLIILAMLAMVAIFSHAQTSMTSLQFKNTKWEIIEAKDSKINRFWDFSDKKLSSYEHYAGHKSHGIEYSYYLTSSCSENFNNSKVGSNTAGCYLYLYNNKLKTSSFWLITSYDQSQGIITVTSNTNTNKQSVVIGGKSTTLHLRIVK